MQKNFSYYLLLLIVFLVPTQLSYHPWPAYSFVSGQPIDYLSPAIYLVDLLILIYLSIHVKNIWQIIKNNFLNNKFKLIICILIFALINIIFSQVPLIALYAWTKTLLTLLLGVIVYVNFQQHSSKSLLNMFYISLAIFGLLAVLQFASGTSVGGVWSIFGERPLLLSNPQVAKSIVSGSLLLRPYSTFPHPNALSGFALIALVITLTKIEKYKLPISLLISGLILITQSRSTIILATIFICYWVYQIVDKRTSKKILSKALVIIFGLVALFMTSQFSPLTFSKSLKQRNDQIKITTELILVNPLIGSGLNNYLVVLEAAGKSHITGLQPVHNIPLLILTEIGLFGIGLILIVAYSFRNQLINNKPLMLLLVCVVITAQIDHYWVTSHQNFLLLVLLPTLCLNAKHHS